MAAEPLFDTHVHLDLLPDDWSLEEEVNLARRAGVDRFLLPGVPPSGWPRLLATAREIAGAWAAPGVHPLAAECWDRDTSLQLERLLGHERVAAIGEIGLDALPGMPAAARQEKVLRAQLQMARAAGKPVVLHCRKATGRLLTLLKEEGAYHYGGIWHGFSGSPETARAAMDLGFALACGGPLTWPGARRGPETLQALPAEWIVLESDAPDLAPHPHRGQPNHPVWLPLIAARVADLRGWSLAETARITTANALRVLKIRLKADKADRRLKPED